MKRELNPTKNHLPGGKVEGARLHEEAFVACPYKLATRPQARHKLATSSPQPCHNRSPKVVKGWPKGCRTGFANTVANQQKVAKGYKKKVAKTLPKWFDKNGLPKRLPQVSSKRCQNVDTCHEVEILV